MNTATDIKQRPLTEADFKVCTGRGGGWIVEGPNPYDPEKRTAYTPETDIFDAMDAFPAIVEQATAA